MKIDRKNLILSVVLIIICLSGCGKDNKENDLLQESSKKFLEVSSVRAEVGVDVLLESFAETSGISLDMKLENTSDPLRGHAEALTVLERDEAYVSGEMEVYQITEDGITTSYSSLNDIWTVETAQYDNEHTSFKPEYIDPNGKNEKFKLSDESVTYNNEECYELTGKMSGSEVQKLFDVNTLSLVSDVAIPDEESISKLKVPVVIDIYRESMLPAKIFIDMTDVLNDIYKDMDEEVSVSKFTIKLEYYDFNNVEPIEVPDEVIENAVKTVD